MEKILVISEASKHTIRLLFANEKDNIKEKVLNYICGYILYLEHTERLYKHDPDSQDSFEITIFPYSGESPYHPKIAIANLKKDNKLSQEELYYERKGGSFVELDQELSLLISEKFFGLIMDEIIEKEIFEIDEFLEEENLSDIKIDIEIEIYESLFNKVYSEVVERGEYYKKLITKNKAKEKDEYQQKDNNKIKLFKQLKQKGSNLIPQFTKNIEDKHNIRFCRKNG
jgi:hypothetical protein